MCLFNVVALKYSQVQWRGKAKQRCGPHSFRPWGVSRPMVNAALWDLCPRLYFSQDFHSTSGENFNLYYGTKFFFSKLLISLAWVDTAPRPRRVLLILASQPNQYSQIPRRSCIGKCLNKQHAFYTSLPKIQSIT